MSLAFGYLSETLAGTPALGENVAPSSFVGAAVTAQLWVGQAWRKLEAGYLPREQVVKPQSPKEAIPGAAGTPGGTIPRNRAPAPLLAPALHLTLGIASVCSECSPRVWATG